MFIKDRDLLSREPSLHRDLGWIGQRLIIGSATVTGDTMTFSSIDVPLDQANIGLGHVVTFDGACYEVVERVSGTAMKVSRPRAEETDPIQLPAPQAVGKTTQVWTFVPQIALVHGQVLRTLGIEPGSTAEIGKATEAGITNTAALKEVEALGALHLIYSAAGALASAGSAVNDRVEMYRRRFAEARQRAVALVDLDGDGKPDASRRMNVVQFVR